MLGAGVTKPTALQSLLGSCTSRREREREQGGLGTSTGSYLNQLVRVIMT